MERFGHHNRILNVLDELARAIRPEQPNRFIIYLGADVNTCFATPGTVTAGADLADLCRALEMGTDLEHIRFEEWGSTT
jgi:hypothetical protein